MNWRSRSVTPNLDSTLSYHPESGEADTSVSDFSTYLGAQLAKFAFKVHEALPSYKGSLASFSDRYLCGDNSGYLSLDDESTRLRATSRAFYDALGSISEAEQEFGRRAWYVAQMMKSHRSDPKTAINALSEVLLTSTSDICDDARVAALKYTSSASAFSSSPELLSLCFSALDSDVEQQAIAAAETLGDLGEPPILPQMRGAMRGMRWDRAKEALENSVKEIEQAYGVNSSSP